MRWLVLLSWVAACASAPGLQRSAAPEDQLGDAVLTGDGILARTLGGELAMFDRQTLHGTKSVRTPAPVTAIATGLRTVAGLADGALVQVDTYSLAVHELARASGAPSWVEGENLYVYAFVPPASFEIHDLRTDAVRTIALPPDASGGTPSVFAHDGDSVWFGIDHGEWGGALGRIDLASGTVTFLPHTEPVLGITASLGRIFVYGGTVHLGSTRGYLAEVTGSTVHVLWEARGRIGHEGKRTPPPRPIVKLVPAGRDGFFALAWNQLYRVDDAFRSWNFLATLRLHENPGRPDAMGNYPPGVAMFVDRNRVVIATMRDGLLATP